MIDENCKHKNQNEVGINRGFEYVVLTICDDCGLVFGEKVIEESQ